jgi:ribosomal protein S21
VVKIFVREGQNIEAVLRKFKAKIKKAGIIEDHKKSLRYEKRSDRLRKERVSRKIRARRAQKYQDKI